MVSGFIWSLDNFEEVRSSGGVTSAFCSASVDLKRSFLFLSHAFFFLFFLLEGECLPENPLSINLLLYIDIFPFNVPLRFSDDLLCVLVCVRSTQQYYFKTLLCVLLLPRCPDGPRPSTVRPCQLPCKKDCIMTPFSDWTPCPVTCDAGTVGKENLISCKER